MLSTCGFLWAFCQPAAFHGRNFLVTRITWLASFHHLCLCNRQWPILLSNLPKLFFSLTNWPSRQETTTSSSGYQVCIPGLLKCRVCVFLHRLQEPVLKRRPRNIPNSNHLIPLSPFNSSARAGEKFVTSGDPQLSTTTLLCPHCHWIAIITLASYEILPPRYVPPEQVSHLVCLFEYRSKRTSSWHSILALTTSCETVDINVWYLP